MERQDEEEKMGELARLSQMEYEHDPSEPDLIGWPVSDEEGNEFGTLNDMLVDVDTGEVPFATVCFEDRCTAVPLEVMFMDEPNQRLVLPVGRTEMMDAPEFTEETEDIQPFIDYWNRVTAEREADLDEGD